MEQAVDARMKAGPPPLLFAVHAYTAVFAGEPREVETGVLFVEDEEPAKRFLEGLREQGDFIAELTQHIPDTRRHLTRYFGWYSCKARGLRAKVNAD